MMSAKSVSHTPPGFLAVTPYLTVESPDRLLTFVKTAFGAEELKDQQALDSDGRIIHAAFQIEGCIIETGRADDRWKAFPGAIHLYVRDVDATYKTALGAGGVSLHDVRDMEYGERSGAVRDPCGNNWYIATYSGQSAK